MARTATTFANHKNLGAFPHAEDGSAVIVSAEGLTHEIVKVIGSDADSEASAEYAVPVYGIAEGTDNPLAAALALFNGSQERLALAAIADFNSTLARKAKAKAVEASVGPEKVLLRTLASIAKKLGTDEKEFIAKAKANPEIITAFMALAD
jgi:hypothetical protein